MKNINAVVFSPTGNTMKITKLLLDEFREEHKIYDITPYGDYNNEMEYKEPTFFSFPVYVGRVPAVLAEKIKRYKGNNTPAIIISTIGNRHYDDALLEMKDLLIAQGFIPVTAGVFVAEHSIFHSVAKDRPDQEDLRYIEIFSEIIKDKLSAEELKVIEVKGKFPYKNEKGTLFKPLTDSSCVKCGTCAKHCPAEAIPFENPDETIYDKCISCMGCIHVCPVNARHLDKEKLEETEEIFHEKFHKRKNPVFFY